jgi:methyl-accepting chemotaxis protein
MKFMRRKYLIDQGLQMRYSILFIIIALAGNLCSVIVFNSLALKKLDSIMWSTHISVSTTADLLNPFFISVNVATFLFIAVLSIITGIWMIRNTSGPLYRMSKDIRKVAEGDLSTSVSLREKDEFQDVAETLNTMVGQLRSEFVAITGKYTDISKLLAGLESPSRKGEVSPEDYDALLKNISDIESRLNKFQI